MNTLVKIDVAAYELGKSVRVIEQMVTGTGRDMFLKPLVWVFDFATAVEGRAQRLRFWSPEIEAHKAEQPTKFRGYELPWVINRILPEKRTNFQAGEVDQLFQLRPTTRTRLHGDMLASAQAVKVAWSASETVNFYPRLMLAEFLKRRWLGSVHARRQGAAANQGQAGGTFNIQHSTFNAQA